MSTILFIVVILVGLLRRWTQEYTERGQGRKGTTLVCFFFLYPGHGDPCPLGGGPTSRRPNGRPRPVVAGHATVGGRATPPRFQRDPDEAGAGEPKRQRRGRRTPRTRNGQGERL